MPVHEDKIEFLRYEVSILTLKAALSTRAGGAPIYSAACREHQRAPIKGALRRELRELEIAYSYGNISSTDHCNYIASLANRMSQTHSEKWTPKIGQHDKCILGLCRLPDGVLVIHTVRGLSVK